MSWKLKVACVAVYLALLGAWKLGVVTNTQIQGATGVMLAILYANQIHTEYKLAKKKKRGR